jgi:hypothetical protein
MLLQDCLLMDLPLILRVKVFMSFGKIISKYFLPLFKNLQLQTKGFMMLYYTLKSYKQTAKGAK